MSHTQGICLTAGGSILSLLLHTFNNVQTNGFSVHPDFREHFMSENGFPKKKHFFLSPSRAPPRTRNDHKRLYFRARDVYLPRNIQDVLCCRGIIVFFLLWNISSMCVSKERKIKRVYLGNTIRRTKRLVFFPPSRFRTPQRTTVTVMLREPKKNNLHYTACTVM